MAEEHPTIGDLTYELIKKMRSEQLELGLDIQELKLRASSQDDHLSGLVIAVSGINNRLDRIDERVARMERRFDLRDAD